MKELNSPRKSTATAGRIPTPSFLAHAWKRASIAPASNRARELVLTSPALSQCHLQQAQSGNYQNDCQVVLVHAIQYFCSVLHRPLHAPVAKILGPSFVFSLKMQSACSDACRVDDAGLVSFLRRLQFIYAVPRYLGRSYLGRELSVDHNRSETRVSRLHGLPPRPSLAQTPHDALKLRAHQIPGVLESEISAQKLGTGRSVDITERKVELVRRADSIIFRETRKA